MHECPGYHYFELNADAFTCARHRHLAAVPPYAIYRSTGEGC